MEKPKHIFADHHQLLIDGIAKEFNMTQEQVVEFILEQGFNFIRILSENDKKIIECVVVYRKNTLIMSIVKKFREWWESGGKK